jgi:hypothetical protein
MARKDPRPELSPDDPIPEPTGETVEMPNNPPYVDPRLLHPKARAYQERLQKARGGEQVGVTPRPPIPRLDQYDESANKGRTMAQSAMGGDTQTVVDIYPTDILHEDARRDPKFIQGQGDMLAMNQPSLALKYGIMRKGEYVSGTSLVRRPEGQLKQLRPETVEGLERLQREQQEQQQAARAAAQHGEQVVKNMEDQVAESQASNAAGGAAARLGGRPIEGEKAPTEEDERKLKEGDLEHLDTLDFGTIRQMMVRNLLNNEKQREIVEGRIKDEIRISDMLINGYAKQRVPIIPGEFEPTFMTVGGDIELELKAMLSEEARTYEYTEQYFLDKYSLMALAAGLHSINGEKLPSHINNDGDLDRDLFWKKFKKVAKLPLPMLASLGTHYFWFDVRCRRKFVAGELGNG